MRIAFLLRRFPVVSQTFVLNQITGLLDRGHGVELLVESAEPGPRHPDVERYDLIARTEYWPHVPQSSATRWLKGVGLLGQLAVRRPLAAATALNVFAYGRLAATMNLAYAARPIVAGRRYDIVLCHFGENGNLGMALRDLGVLSGKLVTVFHGYDLSVDLRRHGLGMYARLFRKGDLFLPISERWRTRLIELGCPESRTAVHHMGIDPKRFRMQPRAAAATGTTRLVSVARLVEKKGIEHAIRAVAALSQQGVQVNYTIVGDGPLRPHLEQLAASLGVSNSIRFAGHQAQPDVIRMVNDAHLFVAPSVVSADGDEEGIPVVLMEAMAMGVPVVATHHSGIPELVEDGVSGRLVPERDDRALATAISEMAARPDRWAVFGAAGRARVLAAFDIAALNDALVDRFARLLAAPTA